MTSNDPSFRDDDLRNRFAALRREEEAETPEFSALSWGMAEHSRRWSIGKLIAVVACLATMALAVFWPRPVPPKPEPEAAKPVASIMEWKAPTDFLLETPGRELLRSVPAIGASHDYSKAARPKHPRVRTQALP